MPISTNLELSKEDALRVAADRLLEAAMEYHREYKRVAGGAAVVWVQDTAGRMVILTRGEYRGTLMRNIDALHREAEEEPIMRFD